MPAQSGRAAGASYAPSPAASSIFAHSRQRLTPVAASTTSAMYAPPTRAEVSRKTQPSAPPMYSECETPSCRPKPSSSVRFASSSGLASLESSGSSRVTKTPPSCAICIGGRPYFDAAANTMRPPRTIAST